MSAQPRFPVLVLLIWAAAIGLSPGAQDPSPFWVNDPSLEGSRRNRIVLENMLDRSAGGVIRLPAGTIHVDRAITIKPEHSGVTIQGEGPQTVLKNSHEVGSYWINPSIAALGTGLGYADDLDGAPDGIHVMLEDAALRHDYEAGTLVYAFVWDGYTKPHVGQLATRRRVVRRIGLRDLELDGPVDPRCDKLKWLDGAPIHGPAEGDRAAVLEEPADLDRFTVGSAILVTDGPVFANEARGEFRTITAIDRLPPRIHWDRQLHCSYAPAAALVRVHAVKNVTLRDFTIGKPPHPKANGSVFKFCTDWRLERMHGETNMEIGGSARFRFDTCEVQGQFAMNTCHDFEIAAGRFGSIYFEEGCFDVTAVGCDIGPAELNGICAQLGCERLNFRRIHIRDSTEMPIAVEGRSMSFDTISSAGTKRGDSSSYLQGDGLQARDLVSDVQVIFRAGLKQTVSHIEAPSVLLGDPSDDSPSGGTARNIRTRNLKVKSKDWTVEPNVDGPAKPR